MTTFAKSIALVGICLSTILLYFTTKLPGYLSVGVAAFFILDYAIIIFCFECRFQNHLFAAELFLSFNIIAALGGISLSIQQLFHDQSLFLIAIACITLLASTYAIFASFIFDKTLKNMFLEDTSSSTQSLYSNETDDTTSDSCKKF